MVLQYMQKVIAVDDKKTSTNISRHKYSTLLRTVVTQKEYNMFKMTVNENEKALVYKDEKLVDVLSVGTYKMFHLFKNYRIERYATKYNGIDGEKARTLYRLFPDVVKKYFTVVELADHERAYVSINGKFTDFMLCGELKLYFKELDIAIEKVDVREDYTLSKKHMQYIDMFASSVKGVKKHIVSDYMASYLYVDETFIDVLTTGKHYFYTDLRDVAIKDVDTRVKELEITGQELLSSDKVTLRCNLTMHYKVIDGKTYLTAVDMPKEYLYKQLQFALREYLGSMTIDAILEKQHTLSVEVLENFHTICLGIGVEVHGVHIKDIILPGEMREIFNQVIEASKRAEANNIQRREETAATRSLLNTAKLMNDNPALARLKELEALEKITHTVGTLNVYGGLDGVMNGMIDLRGK